MPKKRVHSATISKPIVGQSVEITVRSLTSDDWPVIETLFGKNGACGGCWCMTWRVPQGGKLWEESKGAKNKRSFRKLVTSGNVFGCLAFAGDEPVGWCCIGPRADFPRLLRVKALQRASNEGTWSVTCFFIRSGWRNRGVASALLERTVKLARDYGAKELEGYPVKPYGDGRIPAAFAWTGVPRLFEREKFVSVSPPSNSREIYVRKL